jgi:peptidyl-prolyl cis-trans isomerase A (cyclophilin A)
MQESVLRRLPMLAKFMSVFFGLSLGGAVLAADAQYVSLKTTMGDIVLELDQEKAPKSVANFLQYVKNGHYKNNVFHRVINDFMIQTGGMGIDMKQKPTGKPVQNEAKNGLKNLRYSVALARTSDPNSATSQFFINVNDNDYLDFPGRDGFGYTVFGRVVVGKAVVDKIKGVVTDDVRGMRDVPVVPIVIKAVSVVKKPAVFDAAPATEAPAPVEEKPAEQVQKPAAQ